ncbi:MAG TPA: alpha/beta hydrolase [Gemmataceae bacterium]|nr:alpha/beta hydrolase [Gemmataceae bacterium]
MPLTQNIIRAWRGLHSLAAGLAFPLGGWWLDSGASPSDYCRLDKGLAIVLPGIEGFGPLNCNIAYGLIDGGFPGAVVVHDWTTGIWPLFAYHLRAQKINRRRAEEIARLILNYKREFPGRPVHLLGHSGGAAIAVWTLEALPENQPVHSAVLLGAALSASYPLSKALDQTKQGIWHFWSPLDLLFLAAGTVLFGTADGQHVIAAGCCGFKAPQAKNDRQRLRQQCYHPRMLRQFHAGGHFGWANSVFVSEEIAPLFEMHSTN